MNVSPLTERLVQVAAGAFILYMVWGILGGQSLVSLWMNSIRAHQACIQELKTGRAKGG